MTFIQPQARNKFVQVRTEGQLLADEGIRRAATRADIVLCIGVRQPAVVAAVEANSARPDAVQLAFDSDDRLEAASRLQVPFRVQESSTTYSNTS